MRDFLQLFVLRRHPAVSVANNKDSAFRLLLLLPLLKSVSS